MKDHTTNSTNQQKLASLLNVKNVCLAYSPFHTVGRFAMTHRFLAKIGERFDSASWLTWNMMSTYVPVKYNQLFQTDWNHLWKAIDMHHDLATTGQPKGTVRPMKILFHSKLIIEVSAWSYRPMQEANLFLRRYTAASIRPRGSNGWHSDCALLANVVQIFRTLSGK